MLVYESFLSMNNFSDSFTGHLFFNHFDFQAHVWLVDFFLNLCGYAVVLIPGSLLVYVLKYRIQLDNLEKGITKTIIIKFVHGSSSVIEHSCEKKITRLTKKKYILTLIMCTSGLLSSYLLWGVVQERIVSVPYKTLNNKEINFKDSLFLEFSNRILSLMSALVVLMFTKQPDHTTPIYKYSYNSFTCLMSSWCQYEALKYVTFPVQVLGKASKVIPVMGMGWFVSGKIYSCYEYFTAFLMSTGLFLFICNSKISNHNVLSNQSNNIVNSYDLPSSPGIILMIGYIGFDSFTSNWQSEMFRQHGPSHIQMMAGTNFFEILLATVTLWGRGGFKNALQFADEQPMFLLHILCLAITSAVGQFFIFYTIRHFGPVTFTLIMTVRQALSVLISCLVYQHAVALLGIVGLVLFFSSLAFWVLMR